MHHPLRHTLPALALTAAAVTACGDPNAPGAAVATTDDRATLVAFWGSSADDVWAAGSSALANTTCDDGSARRAQGYLLHWNGANWSVPTTLPGIEYVLALGGSGPDDAWAVGEACGQSGTQRVFHWDGAQWAQAFADAHAGHGTLQGVSASGRADAWAVGSWAPAGGAASPTLLHWDGAAWTEIADPGFAATTTAFGGVYAQAADSAFVLGDAEVYHFDGARWTRVPASNTVPLRIAAAGSEVLLSDRTGVRRWNGTDFLTQVGDGFNDPGALWGSGADDVWSLETETSNECGTFTPCHPTTVYTRHWDGAQWSRVQASQWYYAIWGTAGGTVWFAGERGIDRWH